MAYTLAATRPSSNMDLAKSLNVLLAVVLDLHLTTKGCHWHVTGPNFLGLHQLFDQQAADLDSLADAVAERARMLGQPTLRSLEDLIAHAPRHRDQPLPSSANEMLADLHAGNQHLAAQILSVRELAELSRDIVTVSLADAWLADAERRMWMLDASRGDRT